MDDVNYRNPLERLAAELETQVKHDAAMREKTREMILKLEIEE